MKKPIHKNFLFWTLLVLFVLGGIVFAYIHHKQNVSVASVVSPVITKSDDHTVQNKDEGYAFSVPQDWYTEENSSSAITIYPNYPSASSSVAMCKIAMSVFSYAPSMSAADWISQRLGADPTVNVVENSSEDISLANASAIKWVGTMDGIPTTLVYAFNGHHAYEIALSAVGNTTEGDSNSGQCNDSLDLFLSTLTI